MSKKFNEYNTSIYDVNSMSEYIADNTVIRNTSETGLNANEYYVANNQYITMKSDGTKRVGILVELKETITHGDFIGVSLEMMSVDGNYPTVNYEEYSGVNTRVTKLNTVNTSGHFELVVDKQFINNAYGARMGRVFIGLDVGKSGTFSFRFAHVTHYHQGVYARKNTQKNYKVFGFSKSSGGTWDVIPSNIAKYYDPSTITVSGNSMKITLVQPFIVDESEVFFSMNSNFKGLSIFKGSITQSEINLVLFNNDGTAKDWNDAPTYAGFTVMAVATLAH